MTTPLVLTFVGRDRPGLVNAIAERVASAGGTWLESRLVRLAGEFAGVVLVAAPPDTFEALAATLAGLETAGLRVTISPS
jgi:glycine cleavage system regulatory protein